MLGFIREKASSLIIKTSLGVIILVFIFFFGYTSLRSRSSQSFGPKTVAMVNGVPISAVTLEFYADQQRKRMEEQFKGKGALPAAWNDFIRKNVLGSLVNRELLSQLAASLDMKVSDEELANHIVTLWPAGEFDEVQYKTRHLPYFREERGEDFEEMIRKQMLIEKLHDSLTQNVVLSDDDLLAAYLSKETRISLDYATTEEKEGSPCAVASALNKKDKGLKETIKNLSFDELRKKLPLSLTEDQLASLMALTPQSPFLKEPINMGNNTCLIAKLSKKVLPSMANFAKGKEAFVESLKAERVQDLEDSLLNEFEQKSKIQQNL